MSLAAEHGALAAWCLVRGDTSDTLRLDVGWSHGVALLYALALEIDERMATRTGDAVCRACAGRGERIRYVDADGVGQWPLSTITFGPELPSEVRTQINWGRVWRVGTEPCDCTGPARTESVALHHIVALLADLPRPHFEWPEPWLVWLDMLDDGQREPPPWLASHATMTEVPDWIARWWLAFREWTHAGKTPDADALAVDLQALPRLERREAAKRAGGPRDRRRWSGDVPWADDPRVWRQEYEQEFSGPHWSRARLSIGGQELEVDLCGDVNSLVMRVHLMAETRHDLEHWVRSRPREPATLRALGTRGVAELEVRIESIQHHRARIGWLTEMRAVRMEAVGLFPTAEERQRQRYADAPITLGHLGDLLTTPDERTEIAKSRRHDIGVGLPVGLFGRDGETD